MISEHENRTRVAIIGGGASGVLAAHALVVGNDVSEVVVVDPKPGRGVAYGGSHALHLLNTRASNMSLDIEHPGHFLSWLNAGPVDGKRWDPNDFAPRKVYGDYLQGRLRQLAEADQVRLATDRAIGLARTGSGWRVRLAHGEAIEADVVVLATGNARPQPLAFPGRDAVDALVVDDPWDEAAIAAAPGTGTVLLVGTGLTAVDAAVTLLKRPAGPAVVAASRRGLLPRIHDRPHDHPPQLPRPFPTTARGLYRHVRAFAEAEAGGDVYARHGVFMGMKALIPELWSGLPLAEKRRFARHLRAWWEVERHRLAPAIAAILAEGEAHGRFTAERGRIVAAEPAGDGARVTLESGPQRRTLEVTRIVNCTGPDWRITRTTDPLLRSLLDAGARPDAMGLGLDVDPMGEVQAQDGPLSGLYALGPLTRGTFFEVTAVPEIRAQADVLARRIALRGSAAVPTTRLAPVTA
jgi:uncharacterized NAD(P)/FAD-binding protein YdhS